MKTILDGLEELSFIVAGVRRKMSKYVISEVRVDALDPSDIRSINLHLEQLDEVITELTLQVEEERKNSDSELKLDRSLKALLEMEPKEFSAAVEEYVKSREDKAAKERDGAATGRVLSLFDDE